MTGKAQKARKMPVAIVQIWVPDYTPSIAGKIRFKVSKMVTVSDPAAQVINKAYNRILRYHNEREQAATKQHPSGGVLYHYTNADGLKGIIENEELWATSAYYLNDSAEILYGYRVLDSALEEWLKQASPPEDSISRGLVTTLRRYFGHDAVERHIITPIYLSSFCEEDNLLSQWRAYGSSGGYSVGFRVPAEGIFYGLKPEPPVYTARCVKVEYDRDRQIQRVLEILDSVLPILDEPEVTGAVRSIDSLSPLGFSSLLRIIQEMLVEESIGFKDAAFAVEKEWRVVVRSRDLLKQGSDDGDHANLKIHFRTARGRLIPYVKLKPDNAPTPLVGGREDPTYRERALRAYGGPNLSMDGGSWIAQQ
jgi:hypothetical protein